MKPSASLIAVDAETQIVGGFSFHFELIFFSPILNKYDYLCCCWSLRWIGLIQSQRCAVTITIVLLLPLCDAACCCNRLSCQKCQNSRGPCVCVLLCVFWAQAHVNFFQHFKNSLRWRCDMTQPPKWFIHYIDIYDNIKITITTTTTNNFFCFNSQWIFALHAAWLEICFCNQGIFFFEKYLFYIYFSNSKLNSRQCQAIDLRFLCGYSACFFVRDFL